MPHIEYTPEQLNQVEQYASIYLKISDIAVLFDIPAEQLREDIADRSTEVSKRYHKGKAASKVKLLHQEMQLAYVGSPLPNILDIARTDLYTSREDLVDKYAITQVEHILRLRDMVTWCIANPDSKDRQFVDEIMQRYGLSKVTAYADLKVVKSLLPNLSEATRDFHRWRYNEMILETYQMAKKRKDTKTMEKAATSYAKYNRIDVEDETAVPYHMIVVQPFFPTTDPRVVGINPVPNIDERIRKLTKELGATNPDTLNIEAEDADLNFEEIFDEKPENSD